MGIKPSHRLQSIKSSFLSSLRERAAALAASGRDIVDLSRVECIPACAHSGVPGDETAAPRSSRAGCDRPDLAALREALCDKFERDNDLRFPPAQILVSRGARTMVHALMQALLNDDDEVVVPAPYWHAYPDLVRLAGGEPVIVRTVARRDYRMTPEQLHGALGPRSRLLVLASPAGSSSGVYKRGELEALAAVLGEHPEVVVLSDDTQERDAWTAPPYINMLRAAPRLHARTVIINAVGKIGFAAGPAPLITAMGRYLALSAAAPDARARSEAAAMLRADEAARDAWRASLRRRHDLLHGTLARLRGSTVLPATGGCHLLADLRPLIAGRDDVDDDGDLAAWLLDTAGIVCIPGTACGLPGHLRFSFAVPQASLEDAARRLQATLG